MKALTHTEELTADVRNKLTPFWLLVSANKDGLSKFNVKELAQQAFELEPLIEDGLINIDIENSRLHYLNDLYKTALEAIAQDDEFAKQIALDALK